jgi:hypothetical protein
MHLAFPLDIAALGCKRTFVPPIGNSRGLDSTKYRLIQHWIEDIQQVDVLMFEASITLRGHIEWFFVASLPAWWSEARLIVRSLS